MIEQLLAHLWGDYILQSEWMAVNKVKRSWPAFVHAFLYSLLFAWLCWVPARTVGGVPTCITFVDKFNDETACMASGQPPADAASFRIYAGVSGYQTAPYFRLFPWLVIFGTHFLIDRFRLARYVVWAKNWMGARRVWLERTDFKNGKEGQPYLLGNLDETFQHEDCSNYVGTQEWINPPLRHCPTGYPSTTPVWLSTWLVILADNTLHLTINYLALRYL